MDVFFAGDSIQKSVREGMGEVVALGGIFVEEAALRTLSASIDEIASKHRVRERLQSEVNFRTRASGPKLRSRG